MGQTLAQSYPQVADAAPEFAGAVLEIARPDPRVANGTVYRLVLDGRWVGMLAVSGDDFTLIPLVRMARNESTSRPIAEKATSGEMGEQPDFLEIHISSYADDQGPNSTVMKHRQTAGGRWENDSDLDSGEQQGAKDIPQQVADLLSDFGLPIKQNDFFAEEPMTKPIAEKAVSKAQQRFMGMVRDQQEHGGSASPEVKKAAKGMSKKDAKDFASTKHKGLPEKVKSESFEQRLIESLFGATADKLRHTFNRPRTNIGEIPRTGDAVMLTDPFRQGIIKIAGDRIMATLADEDDIETKEDLGSLDDVVNAIKQRTHTTDGARWLSKSYGWEVQGATRMHDLRLR